MLVLIFRYLEGAGFKNVDISCSFVVTVQSTWDINFIVVVVTIVRTKILNWHWIPMVAVIAGLRGSEGTIYLFLPNYFMWSSALFYEWIRVAANKLPTKDIDELRHDRTILWLDWLDQNITNKVLHSVESCRKQNVVVPQFHPPPTASSLKAIIGTNCELSQAALLDNPNCCYLNFLLAPASNLSSQNNEFITIFVVI